MERSHVRASAIVRVIERRAGTRIQVVVLGRGGTHEFVSWEEALRFVRRTTGSTGLR